jgi:hypothetical protein
MTDCADLEEEARRAPHNFDFGDLEALAECWGFEFQRQKGSHRIWKQTEFPYPDTHRERKEYGRMNFQERSGQAVAYQVQQLLDAIEYYRENHPDLV